MKLFTSLLLLSLCGPNVFAQQQTEKEKLETKLYEAIGEVVVRRDETLKKCAVILYGEGSGIRPGQAPRTILRFHCRVVDKSRDFDLAASFFVQPNDSLEHGDEIVRSNGKCKGRRSGSLMAAAYEEKPAGKKASAWLASFNQAEGVDPFDDFMVGANGLEFRNDPGLIENVFLTNGTLLGVKTSIGDRLIADWELVFLEGFTKIKTIEFDPAYEMMPVRVSDRVEGRPNDFWEMRTRWTKFGKHLLPSKIETGQGDIDNGISRTEYTYKCLWAIGDEVPDSIFNSEDHLAALFDHFKLPRPVKAPNGDILRPHYEAPADLYDDATAKKRMEDN